ncbi:ParB/RepB/Spo0J family partition protein [candidate division KSB1 bacterium]|nr:ParB/RepB/Spo0J family partition protein [candidate division KSB1 bacterium]
MSATTQTATTPATPKSVGKRVTLPLDSLSPNSANRHTGPKSEIKSLAESIQAVGLLHPLIVQPDIEEEGRYRIIAGERRYRALKRLKLKSAPCVVVCGKQNGNVQVIGVVENHQRRDPTPLEEAAAVAALLDADMEMEAVARSLGRSRAWVARRSSLMNLSKHWLLAVKDVESKISFWPASHLETISRFPHSVQDMLLEKWEHHWQRTVPAFSDLKQLTGDMARLLKAAPWRLDDETLLPKVGSCLACSKRSACQPELFEEELETAGNGKPVNGDRCLDPECWSEKAKTFLLRRVEELRQKHPGLLLLDNGEYRSAYTLSQFFETDVLQATDAANCRKDAKYAQPAFVVNGPGLGRLRWVQTHNGHAPRNGIGNVNSASPDAEDTEEQPKTSVLTLEEKKERYDKRRRQLVIDAVKDKVCELAVQDDMNEARQLDGGPVLLDSGLVVRTLVLLFGLLDESGWKKDAYQAANKLPELLSWPNLAALKNHELGNAKTLQILFALCWQLQCLALDALSARLHVAPSQKENAAQYEEAERLCTMLDFDLHRLRHIAADEIPYAQAWRDEVEDEWLDQHAQPESEESDHSLCSKSSQLATA